MFFPKCISRYTLLLHFLYQYDLSYHAFSDNSIPTVQAMSPKCTIDDRFFGKLGDRRIRCVPQPENRNRNSSPRLPRSVKTAPRTSRGKLDKDGFARRKSKSQCCRLAPQVCLRECSAFSKTVSRLLHEILKQVCLRECSAFSKTVSRLLHEILKQVCLRECWAFSRRTLLLRALVQFRLFCPLYSFRIRQLREIFHRSNTCSRPFQEFPKHFVVVLSDHRKARLCCFRRSVLRKRQMREP